MQIDVSRWHKLIGEVESLSAYNAGLTSRWTQLSEHRNAAARDLGLVERQRRREHGERPAPGETIDTARAKIAAANAATPDGQHRRLIVSDADVQWFEAQARVDEIDAELGRLDESQAALSQRLGPLRRLREAVERYASANGIGLPGIDNSRVSYAGVTARLSGAATGEVAAASAHLVGARR